MFRKSLITAICLLFALSIAIMPAQAAPSIMINGQTLQCDTPPVIEDGSTLLPVRAILEALGAQVNWDGPTKTVTASRDNLTFKIAIGGDIVVNGQKLDTPAQAKIYNSTTMIPYAVLSALLGPSVNWNPDTQTVTINITETTVPDSAAAGQDTTETGTAGDPAGAEEEAVETETADDTTAADEEAVETETTDDTAAAGEEAAEAQAADDAAPVDGEDSAAGEDTGTKVPFQLYLEGLQAKFVPEKAEGVSVTYQFVINEGNEGKYYVSIEDGTLTTGEGTADNPTVTITIGEQLWLDIASGKEDGTVAYFTKKFTVDGDPTLVQKLAEYFQ